jgi:hypothetical protein
MNHSHFFDRGKLFGSFCLAILIGAAVEGFSGASAGDMFGNVGGVALIAPGTLACRWLWMWVESSNVTFSLMGVQRKLTVKLLFAGAGAFLVLSLMFSGLVRLVTPSASSVASSPPAKSGSSNYDSRDAFKRWREDDRAEEQRRSDRERRFNIDRKFDDLRIDRYKAQ